MFGSYSAREEGQSYRLAFEIGAALARAGYVLANGGYDGTMEASARGAKSEGGTTIGVTCSAFNNSRGRIMKANPFIDHEIHHEHLLKRIKATISMSSGYVVLKGGTGTLTEFALVWEYVCKHLIAPRPIYVVGDFWRPMVERMIKDRPQSGQHVHLVKTADEIVKLAALHITGEPRWMSLLPKTPAEPLPVVPLATLPYKPI